MPAYPWQIALQSMPDLGRIMNQAQAYKANQLSIEERERALDAVPKRAAAVKAYRQGNPEDLMLMDPQLYQRFEGMRIQQEELQAAGLKEQRVAAEQAQVQAREQTGRRNVLAGRLAMALERDPRAYEGVRGALLGSGDFTAEELPPAESFDPEQRQLFVSQLRSMGELGGVTPQTEAGLNLVDATEKAAFRNFRGDHRGASPTDALNHPDWPTYLEAARIESLTKAKAAGVHVSVGGKQELEKSPKSKIQTELVEDEQMMADVSTLQDMDPEQFLTAVGRVKGRVFRNLDYLGALGKGSSEFVSKRRVFNETVEQLFNEYRKRITGAAAAEKELKQLRDTMINVDLSPSEFAGSLSRFTEKLQRAMRIKRKVLREGLNVAPEQQEQMFNQLWRAGDKGAAPTDVSDRVLGLLKSGVAPEAAASQMVAEGYMTQDQADDFVMRAQGGQ